MESYHRKPSGAFCLCLSLVLYGQLVMGSTPNLPATFIFGDSLVDPGNNNYLPASLAKANFPHNGIDFPQGPTGRFCNGRTVADVVCDLIGVPYPQPYLSPKIKAGVGILQGVSYASAAGGILDASSQIFVQGIAMNQQISYFQNTLSQIQAQIGIEAASSLLANALCTIVIGSNDFIQNYFQSKTNSSQIDLPSYNSYVLNTFNQQLMSLYNLGFRKFAVSNVGPIGCIPDQLAIASVTSCVASINDQIQDYNIGLKSMTIQLTKELPGSIFLYTNVYDVVNAMVQSPAQYGFTTNNAGCCGGGELNAQVGCSYLTIPCPDRSKYIFWDAYHPTEAVNVILGNGLFSGGLENISPMNIKQLLNL